MKHRNHRGVSTVALLGVVLVLIGAFSGWKLYSNARSEEALAQSKMQLEKAQRQFVDAVKLAGSTPRIGLAGPIGKLQGLAQETGAIPAPGCMHKARTELTLAMDAAVEGLLAFMQNSMDADSLNQLTMEKQRLMVEKMTSFEDSSRNCRKI